MNQPKSKILYLEDEISLGRIVQESLHSRNYNVQWEKDGKDALTSFYDFKPDICVLDVMLPNVDGFTLGKEIKKHNPSMPIIYLTAKNQTADVVTGFESGGNDYLKKPFSMEELIVRIENLLNIQQSLVTILSEIKIGDYIFYPKKFQLSYQQINATLSHRENELIKLLCAHINEKIDRKLILNEIWGSDSPFNSRNLDVYISKIRQYFRLDPSIQLVTLRGVGYHFSVQDA